MMGTRRRRREGDFASTIRGPNAMKLKRNRFLSGAAVTALAINYVRKPGEAAEFEYKFGTNVPMTDPRNADAVTMSNNVLKETDGKLKITIYPNGALGGDTAMMSQIRSGALEFF